MTIRANNTHIIFNDASTQSTGNVINRVISTGSGETMLAAVNLVNGVITLKVIVSSESLSNASHFMLQGDIPVAPVGGVGE